MYDVTTSNRIGKGDCVKRLGFVVTVLGLALVSTGLLVSQAEGAMAPQFTAKIYDLKDRTKHMFDYKSDFEITGDTKTIVNTIMDLTGEVLVVEKTIVKTDGTLVSFEQDQKQLKTTGKLEVADGKAHFTFTRDGKTKTDDEKAGADFIVTPTLVAYVQKHWDQVMKGETVKMRLGVLDRLETVGFQMKKDSEKELDGQAAVVLKMKPSSVIISALVNPLFFSFSSDGKHLLTLEGRTNVKIPVEGKLKDFDGYTVYTYPPAAPAATATPEPTPAAKPNVKTKSKKK